MPLGKERLELNIWDDSPVAYCVVELVLDDAGQPVDWIYRYCNQAYADIKQCRLDVMIDQPARKLTPEVDESWLDACYQIAYGKYAGAKRLNIGGNHRATIAPVGKRGFCSCMIYEEQHMSKEEQQERNRSMILQKLAPEYVSIYHIELNTGEYTILRLAENTNAKKLIDGEGHPFANFDEFSKQYAESFIQEEDKEEFLKWLSCDSIKQRLQREEKSTYHYHSVTKEGEHSYFEAYAVKGYTDDKTFYAFLGFRNIDSILYKEKAIQKELQKALDDARLSNEIISAIAKTYQYISRIDIEADYYEEIADRDNIHAVIRQSGNVSGSNREVCRQMIAEEYQDAYMAFTDISTLADRMKDEQTIVTEYQMKDGSWHRLRFIEKKRDDTGRLTHVLCVIRSVSDTKKREQNLLHQVAEAKKDAAFKTRFLSNMSHDIRTPINGIVGMLDLANRYPDDLEIQKKCKNQIMKSSKYLVSLVDDILAMSKLEAGDMIERELTFNLTDLLNRANTAKQKQAADKNIEYIVDWDRATITHMYLSGNPIYVERLLSIISDNAIKFTNPGGCVRVWCSEEYADEERTVYEFGCSDTGIGMDESFIEHAFDMFSQENESSRTNYEGTGLGLAIAKKLVDRMGGTIEIKSQKGKGTTVIAAVPFRIVESNEIQENVDYADIPVEGLRALVVEDNELNMEIATFMLEENGIQVECAADGVEAVKRFEESTPGYYDVIFMDIMMPNMNGWDATRCIRSMKREDAEAIPIIAMSANAFVEDMINSRISGMNQHLTKPLNEALLLNILKECIAKYKHKM